ncbi:hypothetical protein A3D77_02240 [Candidatus Gottesmanbacteria bacterium RIFCSPHIGHO2_02_FULL_39_11]|uniref:Mur ligase central domain-containing protein n=1 Tax=Candidatus Gottesmanbacteria bacterium RIFCSPHIGHO2_02_FULL_39_11 TaxID=1798382 RepID=A0A1F5ZW13_9BACT|nr:MAG: hypothetical protein A3D77_02240 [Candidatus Gottesmanbacteria bacterium RIFCSPHIGHO2_02_FULL_39_11]
MDFFLTLVSISVPIFYALIIIDLIRLILFNVYIWQRKEYRWDRIVSFIHTEEGKRFLANPFVILKWIVFILFFFSPLYLPSLTILFFLLTQFIIVVNLFFGFKNFKRPKFTFRSLTLIFGLLIIFVGLSLSFFFFFSFLFLLDHLLFILSGFLVLITSIPSLLYVKYTVYKAHKKIKNFPNLVVIGITGSFGKTTTKEFLATIVSQKYRVLKTEGTNNTEIGIANTILRKLTPDIQIFIAEMGAYKRGEIKTLCNLIHPQIGVLTGINEEHIELFGSIENTMRAKYELLICLKQNGMAFLNSSSKPLTEIGKWVSRDRKDIKKYWYGGYSLQNKENSVDIKDIKSGLESLSFEMCWKGKCVPCVTTFGGEQFIQNISGSASVAAELGLSLTDIAQGISNLSLPDNRMKLKKFGKVHIVDDTYNSNPDGVLTGLKYLSQFHGKKWFVFSPLIELNKEGKFIHKEISKEAEKTCDRIFLTNSNYSEEFLRIKKDKIYILRNEKQLDFYPFDDTEDIMIYFSGREAKRQMELLLKKIK